MPLPGGGVVRTFADVSELLKKERLSVLGQLTATVAHELRNPLSAIRNTVPVIRQLIAATTLDLDRPMSRIERSIGRCDQLVTGLLDYTRPAVLNCKPTYVDPWLDVLLNELAAPDGILIERKFSAPDALINVDAERFRRVIINLMDNAAHSLGQDQAPAADRRIMISTSASDHVEIEIADTGRGIPAEVLPKIFEPLFSTKSFGTGLGLPTVKQLVEQHGGKISITSELGRGTIARLSLPLWNRQQVAA